MADIKLGKIAWVNGSESIPDGTGENQVLMCVPFDGKIDMHGY